MKIITSSNFDRDEFNENFVAENIATPKFAKIMCDALNEKTCNEYSENYYRVVEDDYKLRKFEP